MRRIREAELRSGRPPESVSLVAVSKAHPPDLLREASDLGVEVFGENRIQEARAKIPLLPSKTRWHFLGHLQRNKIRQALPLFELFHGVDSLQIAEDMDRVAAEAGHHPRILLEVNVAGEATKFGFRPEELLREVEKVASLPRLEVVGLMTIPPPVLDPEDARPYFRSLRELRDTIQHRFGLGLPELSMGMSGDFEVAIEEGATWVRVGTSLFGERKGRQWKASGADFLDFSP